MRTKGHCVMVVAEGCGDTLIQSSGEKDAGAKSASFADGETGQTSDLNHDFTDGGIKPLKIDNGVFSWCKPPG